MSEGIIAAIAAVTAAVIGAGATTYGVMASERTAKKNQQTPPAFKPPPIPAVAKKPEAPPSVPGIKDTSIGAGALDERRRVLAGMPVQTKNTYGGDAEGVAPIAKKRLLGGGLGRETTGA